MKCLDVRGNGAHPCGASAHFEVRKIVVAERLQRVARAVARHLVAGRVNEARHVHGVDHEALHVDALVVQDVPVEPVVVPRLEARGRVD